MDVRVTEFQCIMPLENILSVLEHGILSHDRAARLPHRSVAMQAVQDRRDSIQVPRTRGRKLHQYANLYFHARNPMLYKRQDEVEDLCVLRVSTDVLKLDGVVLSDQNAARSFALFLAPQQWRKLDFDAIFAQYWTHSDPATACLLKARKCAEVLVPDRVEPEYLRGAYVVDRTTGQKLRALGFTLAIKINPTLFFC